MPAASLPDRLTTLVEAGVSIGRGLDLEDTLQTIVEAARLVTGARYAAIGVLGPDQRIARFITAGLDEETVRAIGDFPTGRGILGVLIDEARTLRLTDLTEDPRAAGFPAGHPVMRSFLGGPIQARDTVFGNLYLTEAPGGEFSAEDERLLELLAGQAGVAIDNARLYGEARAQADRARRSAEAQSSLTEIAVAVVRSRDLSEAMAAVAAHARMLVDARTVVIGIPDEFTGVVRFPVALGDDAAQYREAEEPIDASFAGSVLHADLPLRIDARAAHALASFPRAARWENHALLAVPLSLADEPVALLVALDRRDGSAFTPNDEQLLQALASLSAIAFYTTRTVARERARSDALMRLQQADAEAEARRETLARVVDAQERERRRLAQELHDRTAGALTSVLFGLARVERLLPEGDARSRLKDARSEVGTAIEDLRDLIADLRPRVLDDFGLVPALERLCDAVARRSGLDIRCSVDASVNRLRDELTTATYRIAQEALTNTVRHAHAGIVRLTAATQDGWLTLVVEDDGVGFAPGSVSYGVDGMVERARMVSGRLELEAPESGGARVRFEAPL